jgi:hypothetical protein
MEEVVKEGSRVGAWRVDGANPMLDVPALHQHSHTFPFFTAIPNEPLDFPFKKWTAGVYFSPSKGECNA